MPFNEHTARLETNLKLVVFRRLVGSLNGVTSPEWLEDYSGYLPLARHW